MLQFLIESQCLLTARMTVGDEALAECFQHCDALDNHDFIMRHSNQVSSIVTQAAADGSD